ncbi:MAG TPA: CRTAC1 family protein [Vicinamibacteria bacterium]|nr:CRTAC1 family protein [Vicinamibacteria bacterium]
MLLVVLIGSLSFQDVTSAAGIDWINTFGGVDSKRYILETTGTGALFFDYDEDGDQDVFLVNGTRFEDAESVPHALYRNAGDGTFANVTVLSGLEAHGWGQGAAASDFDNDGDLDLLVTYYGPNRFYRNNGDGTFEEIGAELGLDDSGWSTSAAFADYDRDGINDLFVAQYVDFDRESTPGPGEAPNCFFMGIPVMCGPKGLPPATSLLYRGTSTGSFEDVSGRTGVGRERFYGLGAVWGDVDNDDDVDLYVANDQTPNNLFLNDGRGGLVDGALAAGVAFNEDGRAQAGMGVDLGDYDNDGFLDIHVTNFSHDYNTIYRNTGDGYFTDESFAAGLGEASYLYLGWGTGFHDFDRDGRLDIFVANGHVYPEVDTSRTDSDYAQRSLLFLNLGEGKFEEYQGFRRPHVGRGAAFADYDDDGDIDILVANMNERPSLYRNELAADSSWVGLRLIGRDSARDALGARVRIQTGGVGQLREVRSGASYLSQSDLRVHFGLGPETSVERLEIRWPRGRLQTLEGVPLNRYIVVVEPR